MGERSDVVLGLVVARCAAVEAVVLPVFGEADAIIRVAKGAVPVALAAFFRLAADTTVKDFSRHNRILLPVWRDGLAGRQRVWPGSNACRLALFHHLFHRRL